MKAAPPFLAVGNPGFRWVGSFVKAAPPLALDFSVARTQLGLRGAEARSLGTRDHGDVATWAITAKNQPAGDSKRGEPLELQLTCAGRTQISLSPRIMFGGFVGILTRATGFLKALIARFTNLPWAAEFHFASTFKSYFLCH
jgi:hypothetical protein